MRKITAIFLSLGLALSLCACSKQGGALASPPAQNVSLTSAPAQSPTPAPTPTPTPTPTPPPEPTVSTLAVCGDTMCHNTIVAAAKSGDGYDFSYVMEAVRPYVSAADYAVVNLETTLPGGPEYTGYPRFRTPDELAYNLKDLGFDLALTANNHCMDAGYDGLVRTLDVLDGAGLAHVGTSRSQEEFDGNIVVADVGGISVAFLGYTYGTNGLPLKKSAPYSVNLFNVDYMTNLSTPDTEKLVGDLQKAEALGTDLIAVMIHWGVEYRTKQNDYQEEIADLLIANGADVILGGHSHVLQPCEMRTAAGEDGVERTGFVCYSLGNFFSNQTKKNTDLTTVLTLELTRDNVTGQTAVSGWTYAPMVMVDWGKGTAPKHERFQLVDAYAALEAGDSGIDKRLRQSIEDIHEIVGPEHDIHNVGEK